MTCHMYQPVHVIITAIVSFAFQTKRFSRGLTINRFTACFLEILEEFGTMIKQIFGF